MGDNARTANWQRGRRLIDSQFADLVPQRAKSEGVNGMSERVGCVECGWRGKRVYRDCDCYGDMCNCPAYGHCPKCGERLLMMRTVKLYKEIETVK